MDGQMSIFDFIHLKNQKYKCGEWVETHGPRVTFDEVKINQYYIVDQSTVSHKWFKLVYVMWKKDDAIGYVDDERGIKRGWSWGNTYSALTRRKYVDEGIRPEFECAATSGWWYEVKDGD